MSQSDRVAEARFQQEVLRDLEAQGWLVGKSAHYDREAALYPEDLLGYVKATQAEQWRKYCKLYPGAPEQKLLARVAQQLNKTDPQATEREMRSFGTLGVLRHAIRDRGVRFELCQFKPDHELNPETQARYALNRLRVVPELVYSPWLKDVDKPEARAWRIDLVFFVNGIPVITMELKSEFKQTVERAIRQYKTARLPGQSAGNREPLLTFKRGALVHFAVSQYAVYMTTHLKGRKTVFLPFNRGSAGGGAGNDVPDDPQRYATDYLWNQVLQPDNLLRILGRFVHLQIQEEVDGQGRRSKKQALIFPRFHQWDVVTKLLAAARSEGPGHTYLVQHSAGSGKSNSIAWTAHQLSALHGADGEKQFHSVIVVTDRKLLDEQLQDTIYQFEHVDGMIARISAGGSGSKSEKLAAALMAATPIIIVTLQTFPYVMDAIENDTNLASRRYAIIADEAHSSQGGTTTRKLRAVLTAETSEDDGEPDAEEQLTAMVASRRYSPNLSFFAFTATPKPRTLRFFGRRPNPNEEETDDNLPEPYHVYTMRQAIEEGFILDVLRNYTNYKVAYQLALKLEEDDQQVDAQQARVRVNQWVRLHSHNIEQKVRVIVDHFRDNVQSLLDGKAKAMVVTGSRKEAVRYKLAFDAHVKQMGYRKLRSLVAFSDEVSFKKEDPDSALLLGQHFNETNMNPGLKGRDLREAFDTADYNVMIAANKFQTGFDQPKLCAMYVDKKLAGVDCVQTLSRLNRTYPGKAECGTFVLDFFNDPEDVRKAFEPYYKTAQLLDVSDPNAIYDLFEKLRAAGIFRWTEVEQFCKAFFDAGKSSASLSNICKPALDRWQNRYQLAQDAMHKARGEQEAGKQSGDDVRAANAKSDFETAARDRDMLAIFKKDLGSFVRYYEFMSQLVDYDDTELEKLNLYARCLRPLLREKARENDGVDLDNLELSHYRVSLDRKQRLKLGQDEEDHKLTSGSGLGSARPRDKQEVFLSQLIQRLNEMFVTDELTDQDLVSYTRTIEDKLRENDQVMNQIAHNPTDRAMQGKFDDALTDAIIESAKVHKIIRAQLMEDEQCLSKFRKVIFDLLAQGPANQPAEDPTAGWIDDDPPADERARFWVPVLELKSAAGVFGEAVPLDEVARTWYKPGGLVVPGSFVLQIVGESMEPRVPNGSWVYFLPAGGATRNGRMVLALLRDAYDPEMGSLTFKKYTSVKQMQDDVAGNISVSLSPVNTGFPTMSYSADDMAAGALRIVGLYEKTLDIPIDLD